MRFPKESFILFLMLPVVGFYLGVKYQQRAVVPTQLSQPQISPADNNLLEWTTVGPEQGITDYSFEIPKPKNCSGCMDDNGTTYGIASPGQWVFLVTAIPLNQLPLRQREWSVLAGNFFPTIDSLIINGKTSIVDNSDGTSYTFARRNDIQVDAYTAKVYETNLTSQEAIFGRRAVFQKNGMIYSLIYEWSDPKYDMVFDRIVDSFRFME